MAKIHKLTKKGETIYPATIMDAVVHPELGVTSSELIEEVNVSKIYSTGGIDGGNKYTLETAIAMIPASLRTVGIKCSFLDDANELQTWQYQGGTFTRSRCWWRVDGKSIASNTGMSEYSIFSESTAYSAGDVVNYNGHLYKFTADHAAGAWTGTDVKNTSLNEIKVSKSDLLNYQYIKKKAISNGVNTPNIYVIKGAQYKVSVKASEDPKFSSYLTFGIADDGSSSQAVIKVENSSDIVDGVSQVFIANQSHVTSGFLWISGGIKEVEYELSIELVSISNETSKNTEDIAHITEDIAHITEDIAHIPNAALKTDLSITKLFSNGHSAGVNTAKFDVIKSRKYLVSVKTDVDPKFSSYLTFGIADDDNEYEIIPTQSAMLVTGVRHVFTANNTQYGTAFCWINSPQTDVNVTLSIEDVTDEVIEENIFVTTKNEVFNVTLVDGVYIGIPIGIFRSLQKDVTYNFTIKSSSTISGKFLSFFISSGVSGSGLTDYYNTGLLNKPLNGSWNGSEKKFSYTPTQDITWCIFRLVVSNVTEGVGANIELNIEYDVKSIINRIGQLETAKPTSLDLISTADRYNKDANDGDIVLDKDVKKICSYIGGNWYSDGKDVDLHNPLYAYGADPDFIKVDDWFYIVATGKTNISDIGEVIFLKTKDWVHFITLDNPIKRGDGPTDETFWAPDIAKVGDKYVIYTNGSNPRRIIAYIADNPNGPYKYYKENYSDEDKDGIITDSMGLTLADTTLIDPDYFEDPKTGKKYLFFGSYISTTDKIGKCYAIELSDDGLSIANRANAVCISNIAAEGTNMFYKDGYYYMFCSIGAWGYASYQTVFGRSDNVTGPFLTKSGASLSDDTDPQYEILTPSGLIGRLYGIGHNGGIFKDNQDRYYMVAHAWDRTDVDEEGQKTYREICLFEIKWDEGGWPYIDNNTQYLKYPAPLL